MKMIDTERVRGRRAPARELHRCMKCKEEKPIAEFPAREGKSSGFGHPRRKRCLSCHRDYMLRWRLSLFGITLEEKKQLWESQHHCCPMCREEMTFNAS